MSELREDEWDWAIDTFFEARAKRLLPDSEPEITDMVHQMVRVNRTPLEIRTLVMEATANKPLAYLAYYYAGFCRRSLL